MKKVLLCAVLLSGLAAAAVFAWEPEELTKFPVGQNAGDFILNTGIGFGIPGTLGSDYIYVPPIRASLDYNIGIGDKGLPFFAGGMVGYSGYGYKDEWYYSMISFGGRFGYHFNWDVKGLDTYAVASAGWIVYTGSGISSAYSSGFPLLGINVGARYFVTDWFGFWTEIGFTSFSFADIGIAFKF
jgi:hypothetical protein